jgi:hypothetical protein
MKIFVPLTDDMLDQLGGDVRLVPYQAGLSLLSQCEAGQPNPKFSPDEAQARPRLSPPTPQPCPS